MNDKIGPAGIGPARLIAPDPVVPYAIRFENLETATVPAQSVVVVDVLDVTKLDLSTVNHHHAQAPK